MFYEETPSQWNFGYKECNEFLTKILVELELCDESNIEKYLFNNQISKETKEQILKCINEQLLVYLNDGKLENYRNLYSNMDFNDLAFPDRFVQYYCENYYMMKNFDYYGKSLNDIYFSCCISKTEEEILEEERNKQLETYKKIEEDHQKREEEKNKKLCEYILKKLNSDEYSFEQIKHKIDLGNLYMEKAYNCYCQIYNARNNYDYDFNRLDNYVGRLYSIIISALKSNCIGFDYKEYWQILMNYLPQNDFGACVSKNVNGTDINYLMKIIDSYCKLKVSNEYLADLQTKKIYEQVYETYNPSEFNVGDVNQRSKCKHPTYPHMFYM